MPTRNNSYQSLNYDIKQGVFYNRLPQKVLTMEDPYNKTSYSTYISTECKIPHNTFHKILENYKLPDSLNDPYNELSYDTSNY